MSLNFDPPIHPGEILREQFLEPLGISSGSLAKALGVPRTRIERIVREEMGISPDTALRLSRYFDTTPNLWVNLQADYDLARGGVALADALKAIRPRNSDNDNAAEKRFKA